MFYRSNKSLPYCQKRELKVLQKIHSSCAELVVNLNPQSFFRKGCSTLLCQDHRIVLWKVFIHHYLKSVQIRRFFWSVFSRVQTEYGEIFRISPYWVWLRENTDQRKLHTWTHTPYLDNSILHSWTKRSLSFPKQEITFWLRYP